MSPDVKPITAAQVRIRPLEDGEGYGGRVGVWASSILPHSLPHSAGDVSHRISVRQWYHLGRAGPFVQKGPGRHRIFNFILLYQKYVDGNGI